ncbi:MAG: transposase [Bacteroidetes bacterium HGW-Bacteroidetes-6]|jgi:REP element-mobilizing transposase RayT|nr:MAG: transposase [Bacteroidetes bacterium HGW-Bacteroidetes-6]
MSTGYQIKNQQGVYFLTFVIIDWVDIFIRRQYKDEIISSLKYCISDKGLELFAYVIMTNHIHMICRAKENFQLSDIVRDFKKYTANKLIELMQKPFESRKWMMAHFSKAGEKNSRNAKFQIWSQKNHAVELLTPKITQQKLNYIHKNPVKAGFVARAEDYLYSSARNYAGLENLIEVIRI